MNFQTLKMSSDNGSFHLEALDPNHNGGRPSDENGDDNSDSLLSSNVYEVVNGRERSQQTTVSNSTTTVTNVVSATNYFIV